MGKVIYMFGKCAAEGCDAAPLTRGFCRVHYRRLRKSGELRMNTDVLAERGRKHDHPLYTRWSRMHSDKNLEPVWDDFWRFVDDVGEPRGRTKMLRIDRSKPMGPGNFYWAEKLTGDRKNAYYRARYHNGTVERNARYRKAYGIGLEDYEAMHKAQGGVCAICDRESDGSGRRLSVDHDHETGAPRGLLCANCNTAIGAFRDDRALLIKALGYLDHYKRRKVA